MHPTELAIWTCLAIMLSTSAIQWTFLIRLKKRHPDQWEHAGSPTIMSDQSLTSAFGTVMYLQSRAYTYSDYQEGIRYCERFRFPMVVGYWITVAAVSSAVIVGLVNGWPPGW